MRTFLRFVMWTILIVAVLLAVLRATAIRWFRLPTDDPIFEASVLPTLRGGDLIVAIRVTQPTFGDLVVCPEPGAPQRYVIGRIVGEGGDRVKIVNGVPYVNGKGFRSERGCDPGTFKYIEPINDEEITQGCYWEAMANHLHMTGDLAASKARPGEVQFDVEEGTVFLLSDNRLHPYDSREFGLVEADTCKETVVARLVSAEGWMDADRRLDYIQ